MKQYQLFIFHDRRTVVHEHKTLDECYFLLAKECDGTKFHIDPQLVKQTKLTLEVQ